MEKVMETYFLLRRKMKAYQYAMVIISWDSSTEAPKGCFEERSKYVGILSEESFKLATSQEYIATVDALFASKDALDDVLRHEIIEAKKTLDKMRKIPQDEYVAFRMLLATSQETWTKAKHAKDFSQFAPTLEKIVDYMRKYMHYIETETMVGYNVLLDEYETGFTMTEYDAFFGLLKEKLVPFFQKVLANKEHRDYPWAKLHYPKEKQKEFIAYLQDVMCFDRHHGLAKESEHPFTTGTSSKDVRFTVHYYEDDFLSAIFSGIHEMGHAMYEQQSNPELNDTFSGGGASMAMHESQSRMFENMIGRSLPFWQTHFPKLQAIFPEQLGDVTVDAFYHCVNDVSASFIRVEADELSYPLHIMLRYDIEKKLLSGEIEVKDLESVWNDLFKAYFGLEVPDAAKGVLQDVHWSFGMFGYFPTYALGSSYAAQFYQTMARDLDLDKETGSQTTKAINDWLKEKIHHIGSTKYPKDIIQAVNGCDFEPHHYIDYLINKYTNIYKI